MRRLIRYAAILLVLEMLIVCLGAFVPAQAQTAIITLSPLNGPPGTAVTINGSGFTGNSTISLEYNDGTSVINLSTVTASGSGAFTATFTVPAATPFSTGTHIIKATEADNPSRTAQTNFYTPHIIPSPASGEAGTQVTIAGTGFAGNETGITVKFNNVNVTLSPISPFADSTGRWSASFTVPSLPAGSYTIGARGNSSSEVFTSFTLIVNSKITLSKTSGTVGTTVNVTGSGFAASETGVKVTFDGKQVGTSPAVNSNGGWVTGFIVPPVPAGSYIVDASGDTTSASSVADVSFSVTPSLTLNPAVAPPGTSVTVEGNGFRSNEDITLTFETAPNTHTTVATATADENGSWTASFIVPISSGGSHAVRAKGTSTSVLTSNLRIGAGLFLNKTSGTAGTAVTIEGSGFAASETSITVTFDGVPAGRTVTADKNGNWSMTFNVPVSSGGDHIISARGKITPETAVEGAYFTILPSAMVSKSSGAPGTSVTLSGTGFEAGEKGIEITFDGEDVGVTASADENGRWELTFKIPPSSAGSHVIGVNGSITGDVSAGTLLFMTTASLSLNPTECHAGATISVSGSGFAADSTLSFFYDDIVLPTGKVKTNDYGNFNQPVTIPQSAAGSHTLRVLDEQGNEAAASFNMEAVAPASPRLSEPKDGASAGLLGNITPTLKWSRVEDASGTTYSLQIDDDSDFSSPLVEQSGLTTTQYTLTKSEVLPRGEYFWRVKAIDGAFNESAWSQPFALKSGVMSPWLLVLIILLALAALAAIALFVVRPMLKKRQGQETASAPEIVIPQVVNAEYRTLEPDEERKRIPPWRLALPQGRPTRGPRPLSAEDQVRLKSIVEFARALPLAEPGPNTNWLVELAESSSGSAASASLYAQMAKGELQVHYEPAWMQHPTYFDLQSLLDGQPVLQDLNSYVEAINSSAAEAMVILQDIYADTASEVSWDIFNAGGWNFISTVYSDAFSWFQGKYLREPSEKDYSIKVENNSTDGTMSYWLYGERNTPFPGKLIRAPGEAEAEELRDLHLRLRRNYRSNDRTRDVVSMITQLEIQRRRLTNAFSQFNRLNPA